MAGEGEVNPVDPVRRKVQHARGEPRNVERNGDNHHWAFKRALDGESAYEQFLKKIGPCRLAKTGARKLGERTCAVPVFMKALI
jgi:hypothetical protein